MHVGLRELCWRIILGILIAVNILESFRNNGELFGNNTGINIFTHDVGQLIKGIYYLPVAKIPFLSLLELILELHHVCICTNIIRIHEHVVRYGNEKS